MAAAKDGFAPPVPPLFGVLVFDFFPILELITSRSKQDTDLSWDAGAPGVRVFATRGLQYRKAPDVAGV
jgi:hypothetical protein